MSRFKISRTSNIPAEEKAGKVIKKMLKKMLKKDKKKKKKDKKKK